MEIDYGKWTIPNGWNELTLKQYQEIERYYSNKDKKFDVRDVLELFTDHSRDDIDQLPIEFVERILGNLNWLFKTQIGVSQRTILRLTMKSTL